MATTVTSTDDARSRTAYGVSLALCVVLSCPPALAEVVFEPEVSVGFARTDNLTLASENEESETVYQVIPAFYLAQDSGRLTTDVSYRLEGYYYDGRSDSNVYHVFDGALRAALDPDNFFIELGASRNQSIRDPSAPIPSSNLPITGNLLERDGIYAGPTFQYALGNTLVSGSYRRTRVQHEEALDIGGLADFRRDFDRDTFAFSIDNYLRQRGFTWAARYNAVKTDYGVLRPWEYRQATLELGVWVGDTLRLFTAGGKESPWDQPFNPSLEDDFWEAGLAVDAGERLSAEFAAGERTFGSSQRGRLELALRRGTTEFSYAETPTTEANNPFERGGLLLPDEPNDFLTRPGSAERYISKRLQWSLDIALRRTGFLVTLFDELREERTRIDGTPLDDERQSGAYLRASLQTGARTELVFEARRVRREFEGADERDLRTVSIGANFDLGPRTELAVELMRSEEDVEEPLLGGQDYAANMLSVLLTRTF